jgi:hypothetical protein
MFARPREEFAVKNFRIGNILCKVSEQTEEQGWFPRGIDFFWA